MARHHAFGSAPVASVELAARRAQAAEQRRQILEVLHDEMPHVARDLPHAGRGKQPRIEGFAALPREQLGPDDAARDRFREFARKLDA